ncbi:ATP-grasp domain-containing protein [Parafrankia irregularis]|uniref:ATP-grasp domain-containing protein n=2 Tax=Frankiaceae TaxID=74712 RepID=A0A0S4QXF0_9ACTN|nr:MULTISPECIES: STM4014 family protein [Parafrankia]CUU59807.1 ATP-grasp domain-containing protein [Parafrankia irregularis]
MFTVVGAPGDRRTELFTAACRSAGLAAPRVVGWAQVLHGGEPPIVPGGALPIVPGSLLRIDSPGGDPEVDRLLRGPGDPTRVGGGARWYAAFTAGLGRVAAAATASGAQPLGDVDEIAVMCDKRRCHARLRSAGVPVPEALPPVHDYADLRARMAQAGMGQVFVKPAHGSSASGVVALRAARGGRVRAVTSAARIGTGLVNALRVRAYETEPEVAQLIDELAPDGLHVERWLPKAALGGRVLDLRVVVIAGEPTHVVVRTSRSPMTNLHLGGARGSVSAVRDALGSTGWEHALDVCARAAACFPGSLMVGVDLLVQIGWRQVAVGEINAFGDLLPGITGLPGTWAEGLDTYTAQVHAAQVRAALAAHAAAA